MKKLLIAFLVIVTALTVNAQSDQFKAFKVDVGLGYAIPTTGGGSVKGGFVFTVEPHYRLTNELALGLRFEGAALGHAIIADQNSSVSISVLNSYCATGEYYLSNKKFRPFVGAGMGIFKSASISSDSYSGGSSYAIPGATNFGAFPRVGFEAGHFRMSAEYNIVKDNSYLSFKIGAFFGGGRK